MTIKYGDYELGATQNILLTGWREMHGAERDMVILGTAGVRGVKVLNDTFEGKVLELTGAIECDDELDDQVRDFVTAMSKKGEPLTIEDDDGNVYVYDGAYVTNTSDMIEMRTLRRKKIVKFRLLFLCPKGFVRDTTESTYSFDTITTVPYESSLTINGDTNPEPVITVTINTAASIEDIIFTNTTTNQQISVSGISFADGDILVINTATREVKHNNTPIVFEGVFPDFLPGLNEFQLTVSGANNLAVDQNLYNSEVSFYGSQRVAQSFQLGSGQDISQVGLLLKRVDQLSFQLLDDFEDNSLDTGIWTSTTGTFAEEGGKLRVGKKSGSGGSGNVNTGGRAGVKGYEIPFQWFAGGAEGPDVYAYVESNGTGATGGTVEARSQHAVNKTTVSGTGGLAGLGSFTYNGTSGTLKVEQDGTQIKVYVNGTLRLSGTFELGDAPKAGLASEGGSGTDFYIVASLVNEKVLTNGNGDITVEIQTDSAGAPSGTAVTNATLTIDSSEVGTSFGEIIENFATDPTLSGSTTYHVVIEQAGGNVNNYYVLKKQNTDVLANGNLETYDGSSWTQVTGEDLYLKLWSTLPTGFDLDLDIAYFPSYYTTGE